MTRRLTQRGQERRRQILDFAIARFAENGYHPTSVAEIVQGLGVGKGVFYWYFESKEELFLEILKEAQLDLRRAQRAAIEDVTDPVERIALGMRATMAWSASHPELHRLVQFAGTQEHFAAAMRKGQETAVRDAGRHVRDGIATGQIRDLDPEMLAHAILGMTAQLAREFLHERHVSHEVVADTAVSLLLDGLLVPSPTRA